MSSEEQKQILAFIDDVAKAIAELFGPDCEVCVSDLDHPEEAVMYIYNGHVSGRQIGSPLIEEAALRVKNTTDSVYLNYKKVVRSGGPSLKSCTVVREIAGKHLSFCINFDCSKFEAAQYYLNQFLTMTQKQDEMNIMGINTSDSIQAIIEKSILLRHKPVSSFKKADRMAVIEDLEHKGILRIQNSVRLVSEALGVSRYSIYNYIKEVRNDID